MAEMAVDRVPEARKDYYRGEAARYKSEKANAQKEALDLERQSKEWDAKSERELHGHERWQQATTALQIAIAMAAIALLTKKRWLEKAVFVMSGVGLIVGALAYFHV